VEGVVEGLDVLKERFAALMEQGRREFLPLYSGKSGDKAAEAVLEHFRDKDRREAFYAYFRELEEVYEILSPDPFLRPFLEDYQRIVEMYRLLRGAYEPHVAVDKSFLRKTAEIVQKHTATPQVEGPGATYEVNAQALLALVEEPKPDTVKVFNLLKELHRLVEEKGREQPYLIPIGERAESIRRAFEERQIESQEALKELADLVRDLREAEAQREGSGLSPEAFAVAWWLRVQKGREADQAERLAASLEQAFRDFPHWAWSQAQERELRRLVYKEFLNAGVEDMVSWTDEMLHLLRRAMP
jgi:type I restriction enzyme R subunit